ncbi:MAG: SCO family protein [Sphingobacteriales bacterium]|jgi:protein SCO1/2|nr:SCO family protein [Sphingobacteriales bacterium]MBP9142700.1 SCO family protein [Chitinophagales bacterium]MDA0198870.1 SCO family protein [Bacteroidota bacterium]MBK6889772.1 SCO family protein [Sphingobacteriales bacterium]MBK7527712.1 SCO family protein [Sphingobacteriales bacterium]
MQAKGNQKAISKLIGLFIAVGIPVICALMIYKFDVLNVLGKDNLPKLKRYVALQEGQDTTYAIRIKDTLWHTIPPFNFIAHTNKPFTRESIRNKIVVADFFFANCPGPCPKMAHQFKRIQTEYLNDPDILLVSHTVDPDRDTIEALNNYANRFEADSSKWLFVTGEKKALYDFYRYGYFVTATPGDGGEHDFIHTEKFVLVDKQGVIRGFYNGTDEAEVNRLMYDIKVLKLEYGLPNPRQKMGPPPPPQNKS